MLESICHLGVTREQNHGNCHLGGWLPVISVPVTRKHPRGGGGEKVGDYFMWEYLRFSPFSDSLASSSKRENSQGGQSTRTWLLPSHENNPCGQEGWRECVSLYSFNPVHCPFFSNTVLWKRAGHISSVGMPLCSITSSSVSRFLGRNLSPVLGGGIEMVKPKGQSSGLDPITKAAWRHHFSFLCPGFSSANGRVRTVPKGSLHF